MKVENNPYKNNHNYVTFGKVCDLCKCFPPTLRRYAAGLSIKGERCGTSTYYLTEDARRLEAAINKSYWLARDEDGVLYLYSEKPLRCGGVFAPLKVDDCSYNTVLPRHFFPEVTYKNSPIEIKIKI